MEELKQSRMETGKAREESGASAGKEVRPGLDKRKREIEERRKAVEAKRRKVKDPSTMPSNGSATVAIGTREGPSSIPEILKPNSDQKPSQPQSADEFLAALERDIMAAKAKGV